jgi:DNA polymerase-3 subunit delta
VIFLFYGADDYSIREAVRALQEAVGGPEVRDANTTRLAGGEATPGHLVGLCAAVPFLADRRLIIVEGLLASLEGARFAGGAAEAQETGSRGAAGRWRGLAATLQGMAPTTDLLFLDGPLRRNNPLFRDLAPVAQVREFTPLSGAELGRWILGRAAQRGVSISPGAVRLLVDLLGPDLWAQSNEMEKLTLYCGERGIGEGEVEELVAPAREARIFSAVDAVMEGNSHTALHLVSRLLNTGVGVFYILSMLARQVRQVLLAQEMLQHRLPSAELGSRLGITAPYALRKTLEQARRATPDEMRRMHGLMLETDVAIKTGELGERLALELLVGRICQGDPRSRAP